MIWKEILIRYGELSTKGRNKMDFIRRLRENIRYAFADLGTIYTSAQNATECLLPFKMKHRWMFY